MNRLKQRLSALAVVGALLGGGLVSVVAVPASAAEGVVVVQSKSEAPETTVWTDGVPDPATCTVTDTGVNTVPGQRHDAETELRYAYKQVIPGQTELSHQEYKYSRTVADYKTQYFFAKFTREKTKSADTPGFWQQFSPNRHQGPLDSAPSYPTDPRGTWGEKKYNGGPQQGASGVFLNGNGGNASYFYRAQAVPGTWTDFGPWTLWKPVQHTSWQDSNAPLGSPQQHASGPNFYREWQAQATGETKQVQIGTHVETSDWLTAPPAGEGWTQIEERKVIDRYKTDDKTVYFNPAGEPTATLTDANYTTGNPGSPWVKVDEKRFETKAAYSDPDVVTNYSYTHQAEDCVVPPLPANPTATATAVCDAVDVVLTNPIVKDANQMTASFVVLVDGKFYDAYAVEVGDREAFSIKGDHKVEVRTGPAFGYELLASAESKTDCVVPPTEEPPVVTPPVTETPKPTPSATPTPAPAPETGSLAATGIDGGVLWGAGIATVLLIGVGLYLLVGRRKKDDAEAESVETE